MLSTRGVTKHRTTSPPAAGTTTVAFGTTTLTIDPLLSFGIDVTGYTGDANDIRTAGVIRSQTQSLAPGLFRLGMKWDRTNLIPLNGATSGVGLSDDWVAGINAAKPGGAKILAIFEGDVTIGPSTYQENGCTPADAQAMVHYYNDGGGAHGGPLTHVIVGNEPDLAGTPKFDYHGNDLHDGRLYGAYWWEIYNAIKAVDPTILVGGPGASQLSGHIQTTIANATSPGAITQWWNDFFQVVDPLGTGNKVSDVIQFLDYHFYGTGTFNETTATVMARVTLPFTEVPNLRNTLSAYSAGRGTGMPVIISEYNFAYKGQDGRNDLLDEFGVGCEGRFITAVNEVYTFAYILNSLRNGGWSTFFGDVVGPLGLFTRNNTGDRMVVSGVDHHYPHNKPAGTPYAGYRGLQMWTGGGLFRRPGASMVSVTGGQTNTQVLAFKLGTNQGDIAIANKDELAVRNFTFAVTGMTNGTAVEVWMTDRLAPWDPPRKVMTTTISGGQITGVVIPPMTCCRVVIGP